jgi:hypothetical protein
VNERWRWPKRWAVARLQRTEDGVNERWRWPKRWAVARLQRTMDGGRSERTLAMAEAVGGSTLT